jgi:hypothetical protein
MRIHLFAALRALDSPIHLTPIRLMGRFSRDFMTRPYVVHHGDEAVHSDQHSATLATVQHALARHGSMNKCDCTDRAV